MLTIVNPNTPQAMLDTLKDLGHLVIPSLLLDSSILTHPDQQIHLVNDTTAIIAPDYYNYYREKLPESISLVCGKTNPSGTYPKDCAYNVTRIGQYVFYNTNSVDPQIDTYYKDAGYQIIHINQGYAKCNMAILGNDCILTEDKGIHNTIIANKLKIESILLPVGEIALTGFPYGFIGGSCGGVKKQLFWYGNPERCSYYSHIKHATEKRGIKNISLSSDSLCDLGGIICFSL